MPFVQAKCTNCGANLEVDRDKDAAICPYCNSAYIVEKAINNYNTTNNIRADVVNVYGSANSDFVIRAGTLIKYNGAAVDVTIPDDVVAIESAFENCIGLKSVTIPDGVTLIGDNAFKNCKNLASVHFPNEVTSIGNFSFNGCINLTSVKLPNKVSRIGSNAFEGCIGLTSIALPDKLSEIGASAFKGCSGLTSVTIPGGVTYIGDSAFWGCDGVTTVSLATSDIQIPSGLNFGKNLKKIVFLPGVETADLGLFCNSRFAFYSNGNTGVETIVFPDSVKRIINGCKVRDMDYSDGWRNVTFFRNVKQIIASPDVEAKHKYVISTLTSTGNGCYIATAVYGSYDCPEVWTLRRYRDNGFAKTWYGRAFIHSYYAISPTFVKWFGDTKWFKNMWKPRLDKMVVKLQNKGFGSTPYSDKYWKRTK